MSLRTPWTPRQPQQRSSQETSCPSDSKTGHGPWKAAPSALPPPHPKSAERQEDCLLDTDDLRVKGKTRIAKVLRFTCAICKSSGVVGDPVFDPESNTIAYTYFRHLKLGSKITQKTVLHLRPASPDEPTGKQVVYAIGDPKLNMRITSMPILGPIQLWGFRMLMSGFILFVASIMELFTSPFERVTRDAPQDPQVDVENGTNARR